MNRLGDELLSGAAPPAECRRDTSVSATTAIVVRRFSIAAEATEDLVLVAAAQVVDLAAERRSARARFCTDFSRRYTTERLVDEIVQAKPGWPRASRPSTLPQRPR